jgi:hypothetical protein
VPWLCWHRNARVSRCQHISYCAVSFFRSEAHGIKRRWVTQANANGSGLESDDEQLETTEREYSHEDDSEAEVEATVGWNGWRPRNKRRRRRFVNTCSTPAVARAWSEPQRDPADWLSPEPERAEQTEMGWMRAEEGGEAAPEEAVAEQTQGMETAEAAALMGLDLLLEAAGALQAQDAVPARIAAPVEEEVKTFETADWLSPRPADIAGAWEAAKLAEAQETWCSAPISLPILVVAPPALCGESLPPIALSVMRVPLYSDAGFGWELHESPPRRCIVRVTLDAAGLWVR